MLILASKTDTKREAKVTKAALKARYTALNNLYIQAEKKARDSVDGVLEEKWKELAEK